MYSDSESCSPVGLQTMHTAASTAKFRDSQITCSSQANCQGRKGATVASNEGVPAG